MDRRVADGSRDGFDPGVGVAELAGGQVHPPLGEVLRRVLPGRVLEASCQGGTGDHQSLREAFGAPGFAGQAVIDRMHRAVAAGVQTREGEFDLEGLFDRLA